MTFETASSAEIVRPCWFIYLDILDDPLFAWTGGYNIAISGQSDALLNNTFLGTSALVEIGEVYSALIFLFGNGTGLAVFVWWLERHPPGAP